MTENETLLTRLNADKLDYLFSSVLALAGEKTDVRILEPESQYDENWVIVARGYALRVTPEMIGQVASYCDTEQMSLQWFDMVAGIVKNPNDRSLQLKPYVHIPEGAQTYGLGGGECNTLTGEDYDAIDMRFMVHYATLKGYYETLYDVCRQASQSHMTLSHDLSQDVSLHFSPEKQTFLDIHVSCQAALTRQVVNTLSYQHQRDAFIAFFPADNAEGKTKMVPYGQQISGCLDGMNNVLNDFVSHYQDDDNKLEYATVIANDFVTTLTKVGSPIPYYQFGEGISNVEDHPEIMETLDMLTVLLLNHVMSIPASAIGDEYLEQVDHYAFDYENFLIYARDKHYQVIAELTNPQYAISPLLDTVSEGAYGLLTLRLAELRNKHVFKKIGKLVMAENPNVLH